MLEKITELPRENEQWTFKGGKGNKTAFELKNVNEIYYERDNEQEEWKISDIQNRIKNKLLNTHEYS